MLVSLLNILILLIFPFLFVGIINKTKAFWAGRKGASIFQPFFDFVRLIKKDMVMSNITTTVFSIAPTITFASIIFAGWLVPIIAGKSIISFEGSFVLFAYILALGKFFSLIGAMDTGSSFEGMGASREANFSIIIEPAFFIIIASIIALTGNYSFKSFSMIIQKSDGIGFLIIAMAVISIFIILLVEGCRIPVDDPNTHLELTMIHEVMVLDNSGIDLAFIQYGSAMKMIIFSSLIANLIIPAGIGLSLFAPAYLLVVLFLALIIGTIESSFARLRMAYMFEFVFIMSSFSLIILSLTAMKLYGN